MSNQSPKRVIPIKMERPSSLSATDQKAVLDSCASLKSLPGALLPILHDVQAALGYVPKDAVPLIAGELKRSQGQNPFRKVLLDIGQQITVFKARMMAKLEVEMAREIGFISRSKTATTSKGLRSADAHR